jgi:hypothetical protein
MRRGNWSQTIVIIPPVREVAEPTPSVKSIRKNNTANNYKTNECNRFTNQSHVLVNKYECITLTYTWGTQSNLEIASGYEMNASPGPDLATTDISTSNSFAKLPRIAKIVNPASNEVKVSIKLMMRASLKSWNCFK